jgi:hypothetical protein
VAKPSPRPTDKPSPKVFTDDDLKTYRQEPQSAEQPPTPEASGGDEGATAGLGPEDEESWRERASAQRATIQEIEMRVQEVEERLKRLQLDLDPQLDALHPNRLQALEARKQQAREERDLAQKELAEARAAFEKFEEEARRANVPPGWLRERPDGPGS